MTCPFKLNDMTLLGRRVVRKDRPQRPYFLTPGDTIVYFECRTMEWKTFPHSIVLFFEFMDRWKRQGRWVSSFVSFHREAQLRERLGVPIITGEYVSQSQLKMDI